MPLGVARAAAILSYDHTRTSNSVLLGAIALSRAARAHSVVFRPGSGDPYGSPDPTGHGSEIALTRVKRVKIWDNKKNIF